MSGPGDPPTGRERRLHSKNSFSLLENTFPIPSGESPDGTGQLPVLPLPGFRTGS